MTLAIPLDCPFQHYCLRALEYVVFRQNTKFCPCLLRVGSGSYGGCLVVVKRYEEAPRLTVRARRLVNLAIELFKPGVQGRDLLCNLPSVGDRNRGNELVQAQTVALISGSVARWTQSPPW